MHAGLSIVGMIRDDDPSPDFSSFLPGNRPFFSSGETLLATALSSSKTQDDASSPSPVTIGSYLIDRFHAIGVNHVFGIPGDYILGLYKMLEASPIELIGVTKEDSAGFAADAYARVHGIGCVAVTY